MLGEGSTKVRCGEERRFPYGKRSLRDDGKWDAAESMQQDALLRQLPEFEEFGDGFEGGEGFDVEPFEGFDNGVGLAEEGELE